MSQLRSTRLLALIGPTTGERRAAHTAGYPLDSSKMLPVADVVLLVAGGDPGAMLYRYTAHGELAGDTWHASVTDAQEQAAYEYDESLMAWEDVPIDAADPHVYAVQYAAERLNGRGDW